MRTSGGSSVLNATGDRSPIRSSAAASRAVASAAGGSPAATAQDAAMWNVSVISGAG
ncbi:hypothetical protein [Actinomadura pelletieri]|uniref:hypothetical protein n=1 Tax=Actinomadura pelletieri TaxID=111805 RepID=UPI001476CBBE|nr:hypothetical protein [Actinomadura pelletieri]